MKHLSALSVLAISLLVTAPACFARDHQGGPPQRPDFTTIDIDGNGVIDFTEFSVCFRQSLSKFLQNAMAFNFTKLNPVVNLTISALYYSLNMSFMGSV